MLEQSFVIGVTGAQGVGKSTFCRALVNSLQASADCAPTLLAGLGERIGGMGFPYGSASTPATIAAVFAAHLERELSAPTGLVILDRCTIDALAYTRALALSSTPESRLYEAVTALAARNLDVVVHLLLSPTFEGARRKHETEELRAAVADEIGKIVGELQQPTVSIDASSPDAVNTATKTILSIFGKRRGSR